MGNSSCTEFEETACCSAILNPEIEFENLQRCRLRENITSDNANIYDLKLAAATLQHFINKNRHNVYRNVILLSFKLLFTMHENIKLD